jgi:mannose-1-phosphate guanylyltransferase
LATDKRRSKKSATKSRKSAPVNKLKLEKPQFYPVVLAGGRGTRFWPLSRRKMAKQLLPLNSEQSMIQETVARLVPITDPRNVWVITNGDLARNISRQLRQVSKKQIVAEPMGRNTAPAIGLAAFILLHRDPDAILGLFPSDHVIANERRFQRDLKLAIEIANSGENIVVMGVKPTRAETGYGYIETGAESRDGVLRVRRFVEKPDAERAQQYLEAGNFYWNSGMFVWSASTLAAALMEYLPETAQTLEEIAATYGTPKFESTFRRLYPKCIDKSVDYAILEPRSAGGEEASNIYCIPADFGWNDLGSWAAHYEHRLAQERAVGDNVARAEGSFVLDANGNYIYAPGKFVAAVGVKNLVVVDSGDALLITTRDRAQDVGKVVKYLDTHKLTKLT